MSRRIAVVSAGLLSCLFSLALPAVAGEQSGDAASAPPVAASSPATGTGSFGSTTGDSGPAGGKDAPGGATTDNPTKPAEQTKPSAGPSAAAPSAAPTVTPDRATQSSAPSLTTRRTTSSTSTDQPQATAAPAPASTGPSMLPAPKPVLLPESATYAAGVTSERPSSSSGLFPILLIGAALISIAAGGLVLRRRSLLHG